MGDRGVLPVFHDHVKRSSRFTTTVPATEILARVADVVVRPVTPRTPSSGAGPFALPSANRRAPATAVAQLPGSGQHVRVSWNEYRLEVLRCGVCVCTVQVYLVRAGLYMVDFQRGLMDIFEFKRFYEGLRRDLTECVKQDYQAVGRLTFSALDVAGGQH